MRWNRRLGSGLLGLVVAATGGAAVGEAVAQPAPGSCADEELSHQFDFWIGEWEVRNGDKLAGHNSIQPILDGCVLQESWRGAQGGAGSSFNFYDPRRQKWRQLWVWRNGTTLELEGEYADGKMILTGESVDREGNPVRSRITWYDNPDGTVRQHWETSRDDGKTWTSSFDGHYTRSKPGKPSRREKKADKKREP